MTTPDHKGRSPAHVAAHKNQVGAIAVLAETAPPRSPREGSGSGANVRASAGDKPVLDLSTKDGNGETPLHHAVMARHAEAVAFLCDAGVGVDVADAAGKTPSWHAAANGEVTTRLVHRGRRVPCVSFDV